MTDRPAPGPTPTAAPAAPPRPPLRRDPDAGLVGGVAAGLARHLDVDVVLVRIGFVIGTVLTQGLGVLAYVLCWIFIPPDDATTAPGAPAPAAGTSPPPAVAAPPQREPAADGRGATFWVGVGLLALGAMWFLGAVSWRAPFGLGLLDAGVIVPLLLIGIGIALWRTGDRAGTAPVTASTVTSHEPPPPPADPTTADPTTADPQETAMSTVTPAPPTSPPPPTAPPPAPPRAEASFVPPPVPPRRRSLLTRLTIGVTLVAVGVLWILDVTTTLAIGPLRLAAIALALVGVGLLVGSVAGRGRALIIVGALLVPVVLAGVALRGLPAGELLTSSVRDGVVVGEFTDEPVSAEELRPNYRLAAGRFELDLRGLELEEDAATLVEVGAGEVVVIVPPDVNVEVSASLGGGEIRLFDLQRAGLGLDVTASDPAPVDDPDAAPTLQLRINAGFGDLTVRR